MNPKNNNGYFHRVNCQTPTKLWINNATIEQAEEAIKMGAVGATTNPTYPAKLLKEDPGFINNLIDKKLENHGDDDKVAEVVYQEAVSHLQSVFYPLYEQSKGRLGYVAIQGDPRVNDNSDAIIESALHYFKMGKNIIVKVPATPAGAKAMLKLVPMGYPIIATLGFSVDQAIYMAETYERAVRDSQIQPPCYVTFIAGILEECLLKESEGKAEIHKEWIYQAGCAATRVAYHIYKERNYQAVLLGGGARGARHFSELVGGDMAITIGFNLAQKLAEKNEPVVSRINAQTPENIISIMEKHLPDFRKASHPNSLKPEEFVDFGPVVEFQNTFLKGIDTLLKAIAIRRKTFVT